MGYNWFVPYKTSSKYEICGRLPWMLNYNYSKQSGGLSESFKGGRKSYEAALNPCSSSRCLAGKTDPEIGKLKRKKENRESADNRFASQVRRKRRGRETKG